MNLINPFVPHHPAVAKMFVGRSPELSRLEGFLRQARVQKPINFMICGQRGIGKTSLLNYVQWMARLYKGQDEGTLHYRLKGEELNFLTISVQVDGSTTPIGFVKKVEAGIGSELARTELVRSFLQKSWGFIQRLEVAGVSLKEEKNTGSSCQLVWDEFANSLVETANRVCVRNGIEFHSSEKDYDGVLLLIDEVDTINEELQLGAFLKFLTEYFQRRECRRIVIGLSGLPGMINVLMRSHRSSLRVFDEMRLGMLAQADVSELIDVYLLDAEHDNRDVKFRMTAEAKDMVFELAEGHPHFIQQVSFCAFKMMAKRMELDPPIRVNNRALIDIVLNDVMTGAFQNRGAIDVIGDIYFRAPLKSDLAEKSSRAVLGYMSQFPKGGATVEEIASATDIDQELVTTALSRLVEKDMVIHKEESDMFRLSHRCLAYWLQKVGRGKEILMEQLIETE